MFLGHFAVGFAAKRVAPRLSLAMLFAAAQFADLLWPVLVALGVETVRIAPGNTAFTPLEFVSYPWSHSLLLLAVWGLLAAVLASSRVSGGRTMAIVAALVISHWVLDVAMHRPDMPIYPGGRRFGFGLWNSIPATLTVEFALFAAGVWIYSGVTRPRGTVGHWGFISFVVVLVVIYAANLAGPPPSISAIWLAGIVGGFLLVAWSWWFDRDRLATPEARIAAR